MKKIISFIAITALLFACSKSDITPSEASEAAAIEKAKGGPGGGGGGGLTVTTDEASYILPFGAISGGSVSSGGGGNSVTERGVCFSIVENPTIADETVASGSGPGTFTSILSGLSDGETYYARAYANITKKGVTTTTYGNQVSFDTPSAIYGTVSDADGNSYTTIAIGAQVWMMENLKTTKYNDGTSIPHVTDGIAWMGLSSGAYCNYGNNEVNVATYGRLYNWYAASDPDIAPAGWHLPTTADFHELEDYVGGRTVAGIRLKEAGYEHWITQPWYPADAGGDNSSGFTALPGGCRNSWGSSPFNNMTQTGNWWSATETGADNADYMYLQSSSPWMWGISLGTSGEDHDKNAGYSVRFVQD